MSLFSDYLAERSNEFVIESEKGFVIYSFTDPKTVYIKEIFTASEHRKSHIATDLANQVITIAKSKGCTKALGSVVPSIRNATTSLKVLLAYGMKLNSSTNDLILFDMDI